MSRAAKRARLTPPAPGDDADRISGLDDDVLLRVLGMVADVRDAARTAALSRRWVRLWTRAPALRFAARPVPGTAAASAAERCAAVERYVSFVNGVLARRASATTQPDGAAIESLAISCTRDASIIGADSEHDLERRLMMAASVDAAQGWIRHAFQHGVRSLILDMCLIPTRPKLCGGSSPEDDEEDVHGAETPAAVLLPDDLPSPARLETMRLSLGGARLRLPTAVKLASLKDLSLKWIRIADGGGARLLARLVSAASCPHLQKLRMSKLRFPNSSGEMRIEADALSEMWVDDIEMRSLKLRTPGLRVLHIDDCYLEVLGLSAPRLEQVALLLPQGFPPRLLQVDGDLPCLLSLKLCMWSHRARRARGFHCGRERNDSYTLLLKHCSLRTRLEVTLGGRKNKLYKEHEDLIKGKVPHLPQITSLTVNVSEEFERHNFGAGVTNLLTRFTNLRHLSIHLPFFVTLYYDLGEGLDLECNHPDHWASYEISMAHLQEVEFTGLTGIDCELRFMKAVIASTERLRKVAISFNRKCWQHKCKMDAFERMLLDEGMRTSRRDKFMLTCLSK